MNDLKILNDIEKNIHCKLPELKKEDIMSCDPGYCLENERIIGLNFFEISIDEEILPLSFYGLDQLQYLSCVGEWSDLPPKIEELKNIRVLSLSESGIGRIPKGVFTRFCKFFLF